MSNPFGEFDKYRKQAWGGVFPLKPQSKNPLALKPGYHGHMGFTRPFDAADYLSSSNLSENNIGLRACFQGSYLVIIDVDNGLRKKTHKDGTSELVMKTGGATLERAFDERGDLPFFFKHTSRDPEDVGGHYFVRVPYGYKLKPIGTHVDIRDYFMGYVVGYPSYNPDSESEYKFYATDGTNEQIDIPHAENDTTLITPEEYPLWLVPDESFVLDYELPHCVDCVPMWETATGLTATHAQTEGTGQYSIKSSAGSPVSDADDGQSGYKTAAFGDDFPPTSVVEWSWKFMDECKQGGLNDLMCVFQMGILNIDPDEGHDVRVALRKARALFIKVARDSEAEAKWDNALERARFKVADRRTPDEEKPKKGYILTCAADYEAEPVFWNWEGRLARGTLGLLAGGEGSGKSTLACHIAALLSKGLLPGVHFGQPQSTIICATEDSWTHTIRPRLEAAGADLTKIHHIEIDLGNGAVAELNVPDDLKILEEAAIETGSSLLILDPLMSRLDKKLDTHVDAEVRQGLEPLVAVARRRGMAIIGLIHHNKSGSTDPLQIIMASKAFTCVARSVHTVIRDPDDEQKYYFGTPKNNLGRTDLPTLSYTIEGYSIETRLGTAVTSRIVWGEESPESIRDIMSRAKKEGGAATANAADWLKEFLMASDGTVLSRDAKDEGLEAGHSLSAINRAMKKLKVVVGYDKSVTPVVTTWTLPLKDRISGFKETSMAS